MPGVFPPAVDVTPKPDFKPPVPNFDPPGGLGTPAAFTKPGGTTEVKPLVPESTPKTDFDVDLYDPKANDSYESISQEYYNDKRFATALRAFNRNMPLQGGRLVEVPPIHVLKKRFANQPGGVVPSGAIGASSSAPQWGPASERSDPVPARATGAGRATFVVPTGGMTMKAIARFTLGNEQRWSDIYGMNPHLRPDDVLPAGTEVRMPSDARLP